MSNKILLKRSLEAAKVPQLADLDPGELALNLTDFRLYAKDGASTVRGLNDWNNVYNKPAGLTTAVSTNTANTLVLRDGSGNFSAGVITGSLTGAASLNVLKTGDTLSGFLTLHADPTSNMQAATKQYVDQGAAVWGNVSGTLGDQTDLQNAINLKANANATVNLTGGQTVAGTKTFSSLIVGSVDGNAGSATALQTARTINGTSFNGSANITTTNWGTSRTITIGSTGKAVTGGANVAWSLAEIGAIPATEKAVANGVATLDANSKVPMNQINDAVLGQVEYMGTWNATTNSPTLPATPAKKGDYYVVATAGTQFAISFEVGDWIISNGVSWDKVDNTDAVSSVAGRTGVVTLVKADVGLGAVDNTADVNKNVASAAALTTARTINGTSFNGSANITTTNWGTSRTITIGSTGKAVTGGANVAWSLAEIGAQAAGDYVTLTGGQTVSGAKTFSNTVTGDTFNATSTTNGGFQGIDADTNTAPSFTWSGDLTTGMYRIGASNIGFTCGGVLRGQVNVNGFVGVGTSLTALNGTNITSGTVANARTTAVSTNTANTLVLRDGSGNFSAGVITATVTQARYADLAENYVADKAYAPGTVVEFGGLFEVTECDAPVSHRVAGVVSTNPAHLMNSECEGQYVVALALAGRVPTKVTGTVAKGDLMVAAGKGYARAWPVSRDTTFPPPGTIIGKALQSFVPTGLTDCGVIEVVVGVR